MCASSIIFCRELTHTLLRNQVPPDHRLQVILDRTPTADSMSVLFRAVTGARAQTYVSAASVEYDAVTIQEVNSLLLSERTVKKN